MKVNKLIKNKATFILIKFPITAQIITNSAGGKRFHRRGRRLMLVAAEAKTKGRLWPFGQRSSRINKNEFFPWIRLVRTWPLLVDPDEMENINARATLLAKKSPTIMSFVCERHFAAKSQTKRHS